MTRFTTTAQYIVHLTTVHRPFDTRIFQKECRTLAQAGYRVSLIVPHTTQETVEGVKIIPIPRFKDRLARLTRLTRAIWAVYRLARRLQADLYHFHDPELLLVGILLKLMTPARVVYDVHENHHEKFLAKEWLPYLLRVIAAWTLRLLEWAATFALDGFVAATEHIAERFPSAKTRVVKNYPLLAMMSPASDDHRIYEGNHTLIYTGGLTNHRGIYQIVQALAYVKTPQTKLVLLGGYTDRETADIVRKLSAWNKVDYCGQVSYDIMYQHLRAAAIGLVCNQPVYNYDLAQPNKLFEYMSAGLPVIASHFDLWKAVIEGNECGITVDPTSPEEIAEAIDYLLGHPELRRTMGKNALEAIREKYNWKHESRKLLNLYQEVLQC